MPRSSPRDTTFFSPVLGVGHREAEGLWVTAAEQILHLAGSPILAHRFSILMPFKGGGPSALP